MPSFEGFTSGEAAKTWMIYLNNKYISLLTEECMALYFSVNQGIYEHWLGGGGPKYIPRLRVIEKYSALYLSVRHT
jgi:hypothetical protein